MKDEKRSEVTVQINPELAYQFDEVLRSALAEGGHISLEEARSIRDAHSTRTDKASLVLDSETAAKLSQMLREGLVNAAVAHQANNNSVASAVGRVIQTSTKKDRK